jgi:pyridoxal phosphate enzyme (YggS family)
MLKENLKSIQNNISRAAIQSGRKASDVRLVAVTKKVQPERIREAFQLGVTEFAENYVQESIIKQAALSDLNIQWHFIGNIQTNKIKLMVQKFLLIHSIDRDKAIEEFSKRSPDQVQEFLIEVNLVGELSKGGCATDDLPELLELAQNLPHVRLRGLMFMPPLSYTSAELRKYYKNARELRDEMRKFVSLPHSLVDLSMGTSHDYEIAIEEGATIVRLGTTLFGRRV